MPLLDEKIRKEVEETFKNLKDPVKLIVFTRDDSITVPGVDCQTCRDNQRLIDEIAALSDKISVQYYDILKDAEKVKEYHATKVPLTIVQGEKDFGIRLYGIPAGHEFGTLLNAIHIVSSVDSGLSQETKDKLKTLNKPVHIQVFVTLSCPYCAPAASLGHRMALESDNIRADMINAQEFPDLAQKYGVYAVPKVVINESTQFEGALPEQAFLEKVMTAAAE
jgi:glutaredoxin-like protein